MATKETTVETVTLEDGRIVDFAGKRKLLKETLLSPEGKVQVRLDFRNGATRLFTCPDNLLQKAAAHGLAQKLGDEIAGVEDLDDAVQGVDELIDRLYEKGPEGWTEGRDSSGLAGASILAKALVEFFAASDKPKTAEEVRKFLSAKTNAEKLALRNNTRIQPIVARLEAEKAAKQGEKASKVDTDALLGELGA